MYSGKAARIGGESPIEGDRRLDSWVVWGAGIRSGAGEGSQLVGPREEGQWSGQKAPQRLGVCVWCRSPAERGSEGSGCVMDEGKIGCSCARRAVIGGPESRNGSPLHSRSTSPACPGCHPDAIDHSRPSSRPRCSWISPMCLSSLRCLAEGRFSRRICSRPLRMMCCATAVVTVVIRPRRPVGRISFLQRFRPNVPEAPGFLGAASRVVGALDLKFRMPNEVLTRARVDHIPTGDERTEAGATSVRAEKQK